MTLFVLLTRLDAFGRKHRLAPVKWFVSAVQHICAIVTGHSVEAIWFSDDGLTTYGNRMCEVCGRFYR